LEVLVDQATEHFPPLNRQVLRTVGLVVPAGRSLLAGLVRAVPVVMVGILAPSGKGGALRRRPPLRTVLAGFLAHQRKAQASR